MSHWWGFSNVTKSILDRPRKEGMSRYAELDAKLYDRRFKPPKKVDKKKVASHTWLHRAGENILVRLYSTNILEFRPNGTVTLDTGDWETRTTFARMNDLIGPHIEISGYNSPRVHAVQVEKHTGVHWREEIQWRHNVTYEYYSGMSFDVETGLLVWNPYLWEPMEYVDGMLQAPIANRLDALEDTISSVLADDTALTNDLINEILERRAIVQRQFETLRDKMHDEVVRLEWRFETTLENTMALFTKRGEVEAHQRRAKREGWCTECEDFGHRYEDAHQQQMDV